jgi:hypothetical protein
LFVACRNLDGLARVFNVFAVDWLGTGLSGKSRQQQQQQQQVPLPALQASTSVLYAGSSSSWQLPTANCSSCSTDMNSLV